MSFAFNTVDVKQEILNQLKAELPNFGYTDANAIRVIKADPKDPAEIPCIGINRANDSETSQSITDGSGSVYNKTTHEYDQIYGTFFSEALEIRIWHTNADERDKLYQIVKAILFGYRSDLVNKGLLNLSLTGGRDEQDTTMTMAPFALYWAPITLTYLNPLDVQFSSTVLPITDIVNRGKILL